MDREALAADDRRHAALACGQQGLTASVPFVDSHAHLADAAFDADRESVISGARSAGAVGIICIGESLAAAARARVIAEANPGFIWWTAGVHPHDAAGFDPDRDTAALREAVAAGAVALGECGLDYHYDHSPRALQRRAFAAQLALAAETKVPVVVHTREAEDDTAAMLREAGTAGILGVMHCFSGSMALAETALAAGWSISYAGIVTFKKWDGAEIVRAVPEDRLLIETDAPYLAPVPFRGKRNEPARCALTLAKLAELRGTTAEALGPAIVRNSTKLFPRISIRA